MTLFTIDYIIAGLINNILVAKILWSWDDGLIKVQFFWLEEMNQWSNWSRPKLPHIPNSMMILSLLQWN